MSRGRVGASVSVVASVGVLASAWLPWLRTGEATRSAFGLVRSAAVLGLFDGAARKLCLALWYLMPFLVASTWTAAALRRHTLAATLGAVVGLTAVIAGVVVLWLVRPEPGPVAAVVAGAAAIGGAGWHAREAVRQPPRRLTTIERGTSR